MIYKGTVPSRFIPMLRPRKKYTVYDLQQLKGKRVLTHIHVKSPQEAAAAAEAGVDLMSCSFDSPEGLILRECVDQLILVVRAGRTPRRLIERTLGSLSSKVIGVILNGEGSSRSAEAWA